MNKSEILELKKRFKKDDTTVSRVCGCYVDGEKNIVSTFNENFLALTEEDFFKYLDILKKSLSGKLGNNLFNIELSSEIEKDSGHKRVLMALRDSIDGALFYTKKSTDIHYEFITDLLGDYKVISLDQKRDHFMQGVSSYIDDDVAGETLLDIYSEILDNAHKEEKDLDDYKLSTDELKKVLTHHDISGYDADSIIDVCRNDSDNDKIKAEDIVDDKFFKKNELYIAYKKLQAENEQLKEKLKRYEQVG